MKLHAKTTKPMTFATHRNRETLPAGTTVEIDAQEFEDYDVFLIRPTTTHNGEPAPVAWATYDEINPNI